MRRLCTKHGILLILDEIFTGFGRTGDLFATMHESVAPDLLCIGKALAGGFPISAALGTTHAMDAWQPSTGEALHTSTYLGNPMDVPRRSPTSMRSRVIDAPARARAIGAVVAERLAPLLASGHARNVRGRGALWGVELSDGTRAREVAVRALRGGVIILQAGLRGEVLTVAPPSRSTTHNSPAPSTSS